MAKVARAKVARSYASPREALLLNATFVATQLRAAGDGTDMQSFIASMQAEVRPWAASSTGQRLPWTFAGGTAADVMTCFLMRSGLCCRRKPALRSGPTAP